MADLQMTSTGEDRRQITIRLVVLQITIGIVFCALVSGFWYFQVVQNAKFEELASNNRQRTISLRAPRGVMFDRNDKVLVLNRSSFTISIVREHTKDLDQTIQILSAVAGLNVKDLRDLVSRHRREPTYRPIVV